MSKNKTAVFDIETMNSIAFTAKQYQIDLINKMDGVFKTGEMVLYSAGRQTGKSMLNTYTMKLLKNRYYGNSRSFWDNNLCKEIVFPDPPKSNYKFSRAKWHTADFKWEDYDEVRKWCREQFGPEPRHADAWSRWVHKYETQIQFRDEADCILFHLRWA